MTDKLAVVATSTDAADVELLEPGSHVLRRQHRCVPRRRDKAAEDVHCRTSDSTSWLS